MGILSTHFRGWAEQDYNDVIGWDLTTVHTGFDYYDSGTSMWGVSNPDCWYSYLFDGWYNLSNAAYWDPNSSSYIWVNEEASFRFSGMRWEHWQKIQYNAWPGGWNYWSDFSGALVPLGYLDTSGGRNII